MYVQMSELSTCDGFVMGRQSEDRLFTPDVHTVYHSLIGACLMIIIMRICIVPLQRFALKALHKS